MLSNGTLIVLTDKVREGWKIDDLEDGWEITQVPPKETSVVVEKEPCRKCGGSGESIKTSIKRKEVIFVNKERLCAI